jgi:hypothetical protein
MMENLDAARLTRVVAGAVVLAGLAASIASCSGNGSNVPSTTCGYTPPVSHPGSLTGRTPGPIAPAVTAHPACPESTAPPTTPAPGAPGAPAEPTEKAPRIDPGGPNPFSPTVHATPAPTAIPGNRENTG